jgi:GT2 family glycosyltransferase
MLQNLLPPKSMNQLSIAICTRDRWSEVQRTFERLQELGFDQCPLLVGDDASSQLCPIDFSSWSGEYHVHRSEEHIGYIPHRNRLVEASKTPYVLVLDDDSNPTSGDFTEAMEILESPEVAVVGFPVRLPSGDWQVPPQGSKKRHRSFIGCAHIVKRSLFLKSGGYRRELVHQGEEMDLGARLFSASLQCMHCDEPAFEHRFTQANRSYERMDYFGTRNELLFYAWYAPACLCPFLVTKILIKRCLLFLKVRRLSVLKGILAWMRDGNSLKMFRRRFTRAQWRAYRALPY